ncbi:MAG: class I SAM-dependent methyltransferase [Sandaracinus sp.]
MIHETHRARPRANEATRGQAAPTDLSAAIGSSTPRHDAPIAIDPTYGFRRLDPVPTSAELDAFYATKYMELVEAGGRAPEIRRMLEGGRAREEELAWIGATLYADVEQALRAPGDARGRLLDVGCGTGDFVEHAAKAGWRARGLEPSRLASERARSRGLDVAEGTLAQALEAHERSGEPAYDAITMLNVLEHVPDPIAHVRQCRALLAPGGALAIVVPNDFTVLQEAARAAIGTETRWWIAAPDHINYFDFTSLDRLLEGEGFVVHERTCNFPMELYLLLGEDYVGQPDLGARCHARRRRMEATIPAETRRALYRSFAAAGLGRNCVVIARRTR